MRGKGQYPALLHKRNKNLQKKFKLTRKEAVEKGVMSTSQYKFLVFQKALYSWGIVNDPEYPVQLTMLVDEVLQEDDVDEDIQNEIYQDIMVLLSNKCEKMYGPEYNGDITLLSPFETRQVAEAVSNDLETKS